MAKNNVVLIGMPGAGKSTVGDLLARSLKAPFIDTDALIRQKEGLSLQEIILHKGKENFLKIEEEAVLELACEGAVIATGGSVVYSAASMEHLSGTGIVVYLDLKYHNLEKRIKNLESRGIAIEKGQSLYDLYRERTPLYLKYADITVKCSHRHINDIVAEITEKISKYTK